MDIESGEKSDKKTIRELREMGNTIDRDIIMKEDVPSMNGDNKLPVLDTKMWVEMVDEGGELENVRHHGGDHTLKRGKYQQIRYQLYEKPMVSRLVTMEKSSLPIKTKITVLAQEIVRWKRNTHREEEKEESDSRMTKFMVKLRASGYSRGQRWEILKSGTRKFKEWLRKRKRGEEG